MWRLLNQSNMRYAPTLRRSVSASPQEDRGIFFTPPQGSTEKVGYPQTPQSPSLTPNHMHSPPLVRRRRQFYDSNVNRDSLDLVFGRRNFQKAESRMDKDFKDSRKIGKGSFSEVFKASSRLDGSFYAIKRSKDSLSAREEVEILAQLIDQSICANVIRYHTAWEEGGAIFLQMELCEFSLAEFWSQNKPLSEPIAKMVLIDITKALIFVHENEIAHLDISNNNILKKGNIWKLADFGIARNLHKYSSSNDPGSGDARYLPREALRNDLRFPKKVSSSVDCCIP